jgi:hypothetical protein
MNTNIEKNGFTIFGTPHFSGLIMWISMRIPRDFVRPVLESSFAGE